VDDQRVPTDYLALQEAVSRLEAHNTDLRDTNAHLTDELASRRREVQELHVLLGRMQASLPPPAPPGQADDDTPVEWKLEPTPDTEHARPEGPALSAPSERSWWRRLLLRVAGE
jgi:hypothetical protein